MEELKFSDPVEVSDLKPGTIYEVKHSRKGLFVMRLDKISDDWGSGVIVEGRASALLHYNVKEEGDPITVRLSFCRFREVVNG